jgi:hypothetical protein
MATPNQWAIQRVFKIRLFDLITGANIGYLEHLQNSDFAADGVVVWADGGPGNPHLVPFDHSKKATLTCQSAAWDDAALGTQIGSSPTVGTNTNLVITDILTVTTNAATTTYTALGTVGNEINYVYLRNPDGSLGTKFTQDATASASKFTYTPGTKALAFFSGDITTGSEIVVFYNATAGSTTRTLSSYTDKFAKSVKMVADGLVRNIYNDQDYAMQIIFYKGKVSNKFDFKLAANGAPSVQNFDIEAAQQPGTTKLWDLIVYDTAITA